MPRIMPFCCTAYEKVIVPEPSVAAMSEKMDPLVPPALNFLWTYLVGESKMSAYLVRRVPPSDNINEVSPSLAPGGRLLSLIGELSLTVLLGVKNGEEG